jgi:hypothetical protein
MGVARDFIVATWPPKSSPLGDAAVRIKPYATLFHHQSADGQMENVLSAILVTIVQTAADSGTE